MKNYKNGKLLWVDQTVSVKQAELPALFTKYFEVIKPYGGSSLSAEIRRHNPQVLLFDYDYPERPGLRLLEMTKQEFSAIPILMTTIQHSESLSVWAFRSRVWDYIVKPASDRELTRALSALSEITTNMNGTRRYRDMYAKSSPLPLENSVAPRHTTPTVLMPALVHIEKHFRGKISSADVAAECNMDSFRFSRAFRTAFGITFKDYLLRVRIKEACRLLEKPDISVSEVAYLSGFSDPSYFSRTFKRFAGVSPSVYASSTEHRSLLADDRLALII